MVSPGRRIKEDNEKKLKGVRFLSIVFLFFHSLFIYFVFKTLHFLQEYFFSIHLQTIMRYNAM